LEVAGFLQLGDHAGADSARDGFFDSASDVLSILSILQLASPIAQSRNESFLGDAGPKVVQRTHFSPVRYSKKFLNRQCGF
jgi:hypothetical protein